MNSIYHDGNKNIGGAALGFTTWVFSVGIMSVFIIPESYICMGLELHGSA